MIKTVIPSSCLIHFKDIYVIAGRLMLVKSSSVYPHDVDTRVPLVHSTQAPLNLPAMETGLTKILGSCGLGQGQEIDLCKN